MTSETRRERALLSLLRRPEGLADGDVVAGLAAALGVDAYEVRQRLSRDPPVLLLAPDLARAEEGARFLAGARGLAFACAQDDVNAVAAPTPVLECAVDEVLLARTGDGVDVEVDAQRVRLVVHGMVVTRAGPPAKTTGGDLMRRVSVPLSPMSSDRFTVIEQLDLFLVDGARLRLSSDRLRFDRSGGLTGKSARENMALLVEKLRAFAVAATFDESFGRFAPPRPMPVVPAPPGADEAARAFELYARWRWLVEGALREPAGP